MLLLDSFSSVKINLAGRVSSNTAVSVNSRGRGLSNVMSYFTDSVIGLFWDSAHDLLRLEKGADVFLSL